MPKLLFAIFLCTFLCCEAQTDTKIINPKGKTIEERFSPPEGYKRKNYSSGSFEYYLKTLPLKPAGEKVHTYDGGLKSPDNVYEAVINMDVGNKDLQQCADAVMRLRAEYLFKAERFDEIHFNFTNGNKAEWEKYAAGYRFQPKTNAWVKTAKEDNSYKAFKEYLELVFTYAGSMSLSKELKPIDVEDMEPGDVFIKGGAPGHAVIVVDVVEDTKTDVKLFMLAQSYMPAQEIHILKNGMPADIISPWYTTNFGPYLKTPEWTFTRAQLMRFKD
jgi:hypothetical protein